MAENPREYIRAAQAAELSGDTARAADLLHQAAAVYARSGGLSRALQLLRSARRLDGAREDIADALRRLEAQGEEEALPVSAEQYGERVEVLELLPSSPEELGEQQRLIEEALRAVESRLTASPERVDPHPSPLPEGEGTYTGSTLDDAERARELLFERGPTRADPSLEAWCSFCCRPRTEVGELVAGPAGSFICRTCVGEAEGLLGNVEAVPRPHREPPAPAREKPEVLELIGQEEARELLVRALEAGVRRLLLIGPEGVGKTTWLQFLRGQGRGTLATVDTLEQAPRAEVLLVEDVERLSPQAQEALAAFLARQPERTVLMTARGTLGASGLTLHDGKTRLPLHTTAELAEAVNGALPVALLEQVQVAVSLRAPTKKELMEIARWRLSLRSPAVSVTEDVLATLAARAARSPRAGHELLALLSRVPAGHWKLDAAKKQPARAGRRKGRP